MKIMSLDHINFGCDTELDACTIQAYITKFRIYIPAGRQWSREPTTGRSRCSTPTYYLWRLHRLLLDRPQRCTPGLWWYSLVGGRSNR